MVGDTLPVNDGAKVKVGLNGRPNAEAIGVGLKVGSMIDGNPIYPAPFPDAATITGMATTLQTAIQQSEVAKQAAKLATLAVATARAELEEGLNTLASYVQFAGNGNTDAILSSGFDVCAGRTRMGPLSAPAGLDVELNGQRGLMLISWVADPLASGYVVQYSEDVQPRVYQAMPRVSRAKTELPDMTVGTTYVFQVAALGGSTGQSPWSAEVIRAAA
jgi:hypothetical protein